MCNRPNSETVMEESSLFSVYLRYVLPWDVDVALGMGMNGVCHDLQHILHIAHFAELHLLKGVVTCIIRMGMHFQSVNNVYVNPRLLCRNKLKDTLACAPPATAVGAALAPRPSSLLLALSQRTVSIGCSSTKTTSPVPLQTMIEAPVPLPVSSSTISSEKLTDGMLVLMLLKQEWYIYTHVERSLENFIIQ